jgi:hypothetical protein
MVEGSSQRGKCVRSANFERIFSEQTKSALGKQSQFGFSGEEKAVTAAVEARRLGFWSGIFQNRLAPIPRSTWHHFSPPVL